MRPSPHDHRAVLDRLAGHRQHGPADDRQHGVLAVGTGHRHHPVAGDLRVLLRDLGQPHRRGRLARPAAATARTTGTPTSPRPRLLSFPGRFGFLGALAVLAVALALLTVGDGVPDAVDEHRLDPRRLLPGVAVGQHEVRRHSRGYRADPVIQAVDRRRVPGERRQRPRGFEAALDRPAHARQDVGSAVRAARTEREVDTRLGQLGRRRRRQPLVKDLAERPVRVRIPVTLRQRRRPVDVDQHRHAGIREFAGPSVTLLAAVEREVETEFLAEPERPVNLDGARSRQEDPFLARGDARQRRQGSIEVGPPPACGIGLVGGDRAGVVSRVQQQLPKIGDPAHQRPGVGAEAAATAQ